MLLLKQQREAGNVRLTGGKTACFFKEKVARLRSEAALCCAAAMWGRSLWLLHGKLFDSMAQSL